MKCFHESSENILVETCSKWQSNRQGCLELSRNHMQKAYFIIAWPDKKISISATKFGASTSLQSTFWWKACCKCQSNRQSGVYGALKKTYAEGTRHHCVASGRKIKFQKFVRLLEMSDKKRVPTFHDSYSKFYDIIKLCLTWNWVTNIKQRAFSLSRVLR